MELTLHQALFGYDGGHQLLAASLRLPTEARHFLAVATDLSGSPPPSGFDQAYTGVPVPGTEFYALFCTWLAPEMQRPGCVWSHVVLIELADIAQLVDLGELRGLFRRPSRIDDQVWRDPVVFTPERVTPAPIAPPQEERARHLLEALYAKPQAQAVISAAYADTYSELVFATWSQQWPRLRRSFRFSTGSFADRGRGGTPFDLQVTPEANRPAWQRGAQHPPADLAPSGEGPEPQPQAWLGVALNDLKAPDGQGFRSFLQTHGLDVRDPRGAFSRLASAYDLLVLNPRDNWLEKLRFIALMFPIQSEAVRLKEFVVGPQPGSSEKDNAEHAWATVSFLLTAREAAAYGSVSFDHAGLAPVLWRESRDRVLSLLGHLVRQKESPSASSFAAAVANTLGASDLRFISEGHSELIPVLLSHRPALAFDADTWRLPGHTQSQIYEALTRLPIEQEDWAQILGAMFIAATSVAVREVVGKAAQHAMQGAFRWLEEGIAHEYLPSQGWREALAQPAADLLVRDEQVPPAQLALSAWCVQPETTRRILTASRQDVQRLAEQPLEALPLPLRVPTAFLLVTLGLRARSDVGAQLIVKGFFTVHESLASGGYSSESWLLLSPELPNLGRWRDWDQCERLRRAVHRWLSRNVRSGNPLLQAAKTAGRQELARRVAVGSKTTDDLLDHVQ